MGTFFRAKIDCPAPPAAAEFRLRGSYQKTSCAPHSSPFGDTFPLGGRLYIRLYIRKIKNGLRIICYAPWLSEISSEIFRKSKMGCALIRRRSATPGRRDCLWAVVWREKPPGGKALSKAIRKQVAPLITATSWQSFPPGGSLDDRKGFPFLLNFALSKMKQGETLEQG